MTVHVPRRGMVLATALCLLLAPACGGGDGDEAAPTTAAPAPTGPVALRADEGDDEPDGTTTTSTTASTTTTSTTAPPAGTGPACAAMEAVWVPVTLDGAGGHDDEEGLDRLATLADTVLAEGPPILVPGATRLAELLPELRARWDEEGPEVDVLVTETVEIVDRLLAWSGPACPTDALVWGCFVQWGFQVVGHAIGGEEDPGAAPTPEAAVGDAEGLVEADRSDTEVLLAERGPDGLVVRTELAVRSGSGWMDGGGRDCEGPDS